MDTSSSIMTRLTRATSSVKETEVLFRTSRVIFVVEVRVTPDHRPSLDDVALRVDAG